MGKKLLELVSDAMRLKHYSFSTEKSYIGWIKRFVIYHNKKHPSELSEKHVKQFLTYLARDLNVSSSTQKQALNAIVFLYKRVLETPLKNIGNFSRPKEYKSLPVVFSHTEAMSVLSNLEGVHYLVGSLMYGSVLRLLESLNFRIKDIDFCNYQIIARNSF